MTRLALGLVLIVTLAYGAFEALPLLTGPTLTLATPRGGERYPDGVVAITGVATRATALTLDGAPLLPDQSGHFATTLAFPTGGSILTFTAADRFGRTITKTRAIYVPAPASPTSP